MNDQREGRYCAPVSRTDAERLWAFLNAHHRGAALAIKERDLAIVASLTPRALQHVLEHLVNVEHRPIVASCRPPYGVFVAVSEQEKTEYVAQLKNRIIGLACRMRGVKHSRLFEEPHQAVITFASASAESLAGGPQ